MSDILERTPEKASKDPAYLRWRDAKVNAVLQAKEAGKLSYKAINDVAAKFGQDAR